MSDDLSRRLIDARRRRFAVENVDAWLARLREEAGIAVGRDDLLTPERTASLKSRFSDVLRSPPVDAYRSNWSHGARAELESFLAALPAADTDTRVVLFNEFDESFGAVLVRSRDVLARPFDVWEIVGRDLALSTDDARDGLCVEANYYDLDGRYTREGVFEITAWGTFSPRA